MTNQYIEHWTDTDGKWLYILERDSEDKQRPIFKFVQNRDGVWLYQPASYISAQHRTHIQETQSSDLHYQYIREDLALRPLEGLFIYENEFLDEILRQIETRKDFNLRADLEVTPQIYEMIEKLPKSYLYQEFQPERELPKLKIC